MSKLIDKIFCENTVLTIAIICTSISLVGILVMYGWGISTVKNNEATHFQEGFKELQTETSKDCNGLTSYLSGSYNLRSNNTDWLKYLGAVYDKTKDLGCSPLPHPIKEINPNDIQ